MLQEDQSPSKCAVYGPSTNSEDSTVMTYAQGNSSATCVRTILPVGVDNVSLKCSDDAEQRCGECPEGYAGSGATGCVDEDGCQTGTGVDGCYANGCVDVAAPGIGYVCAPCPAGMVGNGSACRENLCSSANGGCDPAVTCEMDVQSDAAVCGACPSGLEMVETPSSNLTGETTYQQRCVEVDGCVSQPCWSNEDDAPFAQTCEDVPAPGAGRICGECPQGFLAAADGEGCVDIDECQEQPNGGCWISSDGSGLRTSCVNVPGAAYCTACPEVAGERYLGTGETGCRPGIACDVDNGNCDKLVACDSDAVAQCGACPAGYSGTGDTVCVDEDGCARDPCFPGVECVDIPAPGVGRTCQSCPEGYRGDGATCELCAVSIHVDAAMSTVVNGKVKRSQENQLAAAFNGLNEPDCTFSQGMRYMWRGVSSNGMVADLDSDTNKRETLIVYLPEGTLTTQVEYVMQLTATLNGNSKVAAAVETHFFVVSQALVVLIQGGAVRTGEGLPVELDASSSYDPDGADSEMTFTWACARSSNTASNNETVDDYCRDVTGQLLSQSNLIGPRLSLALQGSAEGTEYRLICLATKLLRKANASTSVTIIPADELPVPTIVPLLYRTHDAGTKLTLNSQVISLQPETLSVEWTVEPGDIATAEIANLDEAASTSLGSFDLVIHPNVLAEGSSYRFRLSATDSIGLAWISMDVITNSPPHSGAFHVTPAEGFMYETEFLHEGSGWEDHPDDLPLWYQLRYQVVGASGDDTPAMLTQWQPSGTFQHLVAASGIEERQHRVTIYLFVKDSLGATTSAAYNLTVRPLAFESGAVLEQYVDDALDSATQALMNGQDPLETVLSTASLLNDAATVLAASSENTSASTEWWHRFLLTNDHVDSNYRKLAEAGGGILNATGEEEARLKASRQAQRERMMSLNMEVWADLLPKTTDTITRVAELLASVGQSPAELTAVSRTDILALGDSLVARTRKPALASSLAGSTGSSPVPPLSTKAAQATADALSSAVLSAEDTGDQNVDVTAAVDVMRAVAFSAMQHMVPGEQPAVVASSAVSSVAQCDDMDSDAARLFNEPLESPSGVAVTFPRSLAGALPEDPRKAAGVVCTALISSAVNPHQNTTGGRQEDTGAPADSGQISLLSSSGELSSGYMVSNVTSISLYNGTSEDDVLLVHGLEEAFTFTLAFRVPDTHDTQARSDKVAEMDSQTLEHVIDALSGQSSLKADDSDQGNIADADADITAQCAFFYEASRGAYGERQGGAQETEGSHYSTEGCATLPNPFPAGALLYWREVNVSMLGGQLEAAWGMTNTSLLANCREVWVDNEAAAQDALATGLASKRLRTYVGAGCGISDPGNEVGCWWDWWLQAFVGPGCVWTDQLGCMCTHLTDFAAAQSTRFGNRRFPAEVEVFDTSDAMNLSVADIARSTVLLSVLATFMLGAGLLFCVSNRFHNRERMQLLVTLVNPIGDIFRPLDDVWSWSLVDNAEDARHRAQSSAHPTQSTEKSQRSSRKKRRQTLGDQMAQLATAVDATESNAIFDTIADTAADDDDDSGDRSHSDIGGSKQVEFHANGISPSPHPLDLHPQLKPAQAETCQHEGEPSDAACGNSEAAVTSTADVQNVRADDSAGYTNTASSAQTSGPHAGKIIHVHMDAVAGGMPTCKLRSPSPSTGVTTKAIAPSTLKDDALLPQAAPSLHTLAQQAQQQAIDVLLAAIKDARNEPHIKSGSRFGIKRNSDTHRHTSDGAIGVTESYDPLNSNDRGAAASSRAYDARASHFFDISADAELDIERLDLPDNTYQLSEIASLRARHSATKAAEPMSGAVDNAPRAWTHASRNRTSIANSVVARYDRAGARGRSGSADCDDSAPPEQDQPLLRSSLKSLWRGAGTRLAFLRNFRGSGSARSDGEHGSRSTKKVVRRSILALQRTASQKKATWNPFRAVSASDDTANDANILGGGLTRPALVSGRGSKGASRGIFFKKVRVLNARGLFKAMKINVFRLQLCIPLDYLEQQALDAMNSSETSGAGEAPDDGRGGAQASPQAVAEAMDRDIEPDSHDVDGDAQQQKAGRSVERTTLPSPSSKRGRSSTRSLTWIGGLFAKSNFFWDQGKKSSKNLTVLRTSVSMKQLARHQSHRKSISSLVAQHMQDEWTDDAGHGDSGDGWRQGTESVSSAAENSGHDQERRSELSRVMTGRRSAGQWQKRHLPVERMLGTAIVQAFLSMNTILSKKDLSMQTTLASQLPWQMPCDRPFPWYVNTFKVLIGSIRTVGWYHRSFLWNLLFLQRPDGSYKMNIHLATVLKSGRPLEDLMINPVAPFDPAVLEESMPRQLMEALALEGGPLNDASDDRTAFMHPSRTSSTVARDVWATILAVQRLRTYPFTWVENPDDPPWKQISIQSKSEEYIARRCQEYPALASSLPELEQIASEHTQHWAEKHETRIADMYASEQLSEREKGNRAESFRERLLEGGQPRKWARSHVKTWRAVKRSVVRVVKAHPITAIFLVSATEPFTRSDRILVQANTFICMLLFAVWFFYSKAVNCCRELRTHLTCPSSSDVTAPCLGFQTCAALVVGENAGGMPEELMQQGKFVCTAFPQATYVDRIWTVLIMISILTPLTISLSHLFIMHANANIPTNWEIRRLPNKCAASVGTTTAALQTVLLTLFALFFKFEKMNKAIAVTFVAIIKVMIVKSFHAQAVIASTFCCWCTLGAASRRVSEDDALPPAITKLGSLMQPSMQHFAYCTIAVLWLVIAWALFTYAMLIREMMSTEAENEFFVMWATAFGLGLFGAETVQIILIQIFASVIGDKIHMLFANVDPSMLWFEKFVMSKISQDDEEVDDRQNDDDAGDQDMGDDADVV
ncbi:hypothetical protein CYMTET_3720 [Cymbomonas tetramitiformis]|uniref:EGF-like domain-containing protein n=1 Tax=Cymbomonas tetramitiformis TaxID=36881 RepID=A0AAE0H2T1_9CHLO|nr:hypothetical protein CYMTET_3720 [Cymbomonas tetramitiformis]